MPGWRPSPHEDDGGWDYIATYIVISTPSGMTGAWLDSEVPPEVRAAAGEFAAKAQGGFRQGPHVSTGCAYLRLRVKHVPPERVERLGRRLAVDFDFGPGGAPAEYPRVVLDDLLAFAAAAV